MGTPEAAVMLGRTPLGLYKLMSVEPPGYRYPAPAGRVGAAHVWDRATVERFADDHPDALVRRRSRT